MFRRTFAWLAVSAVAACGAQERGKAEETAAQVDLRGIERQLSDRYGDLGRVRFFHGATDLDGDGRVEVVVHVAGPMVCGSGGCPTLVFTPDGDGWRRVATIGPARPPIQVSKRSSKGWRNLLVFVAGGGIGASYDAEVAFDGKTYPSNPTVAPVEPAADTEGAELLIPPFESFTDGRLVPARPAPGASGAAAVPRQVGAGPTRDSDLAALPRSTRLVTPAADGLAGAAEDPDPVSAALKLLGGAREARAVRIELRRASAEGPGPVSVIVVREGLLDDAVRGDWHRVELTPAPESAGWRVASLTRAIRCWPGRGVEGWLDQTCR